MQGVCFSLFLLKIIPGCFLCCLCVPCGELLQKISKQSRFKWSYPMDFKTMKVQCDGNKAIAVVLEKRIYLGITDVFRDEMLSLLETKFQQLIIDLSHVAVMNSAGLGVLIMAQDMIKKGNGRIKIANLQPLMQEIFARMRLDTLFEMFDTLEEAVAN
jgi:anti-sigma B factor antagonist